MPIQTTNIDIGSGDAFDITVDDEAYIIDTGVSVVSEQSPADGVASAFGFCEIANYGQISAANDGIHVDAGGGGAEIVNESSGSIIAYLGIVFEDGNCFAENDGRISAYEVGIGDNASSTEIVNAGFMTAKGHGVIASTDDQVDKRGQFAPLTLAYT
jgi:hypothetical protein